MMAQLNSNMDHMSHALPWHMTNCSPGAAFGEVCSKLRKCSINIHPDKGLSTKSLCKMAGFQVEWFP
eukprot:3724464-Prorocentrum_lima.AAC.1